MTGTADLTWVDDVSCIAILGNRGSGKSSMAYHLLDNMSRPVFIYDHPQPDLVRERGFTPMHRLEDMYELDNAVIFVDEPQVVMPVGNKRANDALARLLSIARHRDLCLMFASCESRWFVRSLEAYIDVIVVKDCEASLLKQGSLAKKVIQRHCLIDVDGFRLRPDQYLVYARKFPELPLLAKFEMPAYFDARFSKPYAIADDTAPVVRLEGVLRTALVSAPNGHLGSAAVSG